MKSNSGELTYQLELPKTGIVKNSPKPITTVAIEASKKKTSQAVWMKTASPRLASGLTG